MYCKCDSSLSFSGESVLTVPAHNPLSFPATSWLVSSNRWHVSSTSTSTGCFTGQSIPSPTLTVAPAPTSTRKGVSSWGSYELNFYGGGTCRPNDFPLPTYAAILTGTGPQSCQTLQAPAYFGHLMSLSIATPPPGGSKSTGLCWRGWTKPSCDARANKYIFCGSGNCCWRHLAHQTLSIQAWDVVPNTYTTGVNHFTFWGC